MRTSWFLCGLLCLTASCSARAGGDGTGPTTPSSVDCASLCGRLVGASNCASTAESECATSCRGLITSAGTMCNSELDALNACARAAPVRCVGTGLNPFTGCNSQFAAAVVCASSASRDAGTPTDRGSSVPDARTSDGGATSPECQGCATSNCSKAIFECAMESACGACLGRPMPACLSNPAFASAVECLCGASCGSVCTSTCAMFE